MSEKEIFNAGDKVLINHRDGYREAIVVRGAAKDGEIEYYLVRYRTFWGLHERWLHRHYVVGRL
jgi:hypothetical protein